MKPASRPSFFLLVWILFAASPAFTQKATTQFDNDYDFSLHKRYQWRENRLMTRQSPDTNEVIDLKIVKAVNQLLSSKGFVEVKDKPDFYVYYDGGGNTNLRAGGATQAGSGPTTSADIAPDYGLGNGPTKIVLSLAATNP
jgi:hypothetical protein